MNFQKKVQSMTFKEILEAMIAGLEKEHVKVDMSSFGHAAENKVCFGCAATNTICEISGKTFTSRSINDLSARSRKVRTDERFLDGFEDAINNLRYGDIDDYNRIAIQIGIALGPKHADKLSPLTTYRWEQDIQEYKDFAKTL